MTPPQWLWQAIRGAADVPDWNRIGSAAVMALGVVLVLVYWFGEGLVRP